MNVRLGLLGGALVLGGALLVGAGAVVGGGGPAGLVRGGGMMDGSWNGGTARGGGMMGGDNRGGMMGGGTWNGATAPGPGEAGFVAGTVATPRVIRIVAGPGYTFNPSVIAVARGETVTFAVTSMGGLVHEFMVGPAADVTADTVGTPEVADIGMMQTKSVTYTFDGAGPYAFACHAAGHYEAGMRGTIDVVG
jgi:uncharacterized cupredoxin-like copper-binding protein